MPMHSPSRPGAMVGRMIEDLEITMADAARQLGVPRQTLQHLISDDHASVSPEMAVRLEAVFGGTADHWLDMQENYDTAEARKRAAKISTEAQPDSAPLAVAK